MKTLRICVIGAGPCGLTALKNVLQAGGTNVVCYDDGRSIGGNWAFTDDPRRASVHACSRLISSRRLSAFDDFPMPADYPDFPPHRQVLAYFTQYARAFGLEPYLRLGSRVERCSLRDDGRWTVRVVADGVTSLETFDALLVCTGHHRDPFTPDYPGAFTGTIAHSSTYKRPDPYRGQRVLVVGAGNSAADVAVDVAGTAARVVLSLRGGTYIIPKRLLGRPIDTVYAFWAGRLPKPLLEWALRRWLRLAVGRWEDYGLPAPTHAPLAKPPTVNSMLLDGLRRGLIRTRPAIARYDGRSVHFVDGTREEFDAIIMGTGFRARFPFLPDLTESAPLPLRMAHPTMPNLYFIGLFQPIGCIWRLADYQARVAVSVLNGRPSTDLGAGRSGLETDYHALRRDLTRVLRRQGRGKSSTRI